MPTNLLFWTLQLPGWVLFLYLVIAQCTSAVNYRLGVQMGTQEPSEQITQVGVAFWWAMAFGDLVFYTPILGLGLLGQLFCTSWATPVLSAALGITIYWPIVSLATVVKARNAPGWSLPKERDYWKVLPLISIWGCWGLMLICLGV